MCFGSASCRLGSAPRCSLSTPPCPRLTGDDREEPGRLPAMHLQRDPRVKPAGVDAIANHVRRLDHVERVVDDGPDLSADCDIVERHDHVGQRLVAGLALGEQVAELRAGGEADDWVGE